MKIQYTSFNNINKTKFNKEVKKKQNSIKNAQQNFISNAYYKPVSFSGTYLNLRARFLKLKNNITPDKYQSQAMNAIYDDKSVLVEAPTGTGKTLIGEFAIARNLDNQKRTFYTTPLKALTNQKYNDFKKVFGEDKVGIATGDLKEDLDAPIVVMTTEIYRNMLNPVDENKNRLLLHDISNVIFDEFHYMNDLERGRVWEESIMFTPDNVKPVMLSATMANSPLLSKWYQDIHPNVNIEEVNVSQKDRHVPLNYVGYAHGGFRKLFYGDININKLLKDFNNDKVTERQKKALEEFTQTFDKNKANKPTKESISWTLKELKEMMHKGEIKEADLEHTLIQKKNIDREVLKRTLPYFLNEEEKFLSPKLQNVGMPQGEETKEAIKKVIHSLKKENMLPAISFIFSKLKCDNLVRYYEKHGNSLLSEDEEIRLNMILDDYEARTASLSHHYNRDALMKGVASHHAGLIPSYKKVIEKLFQEGLIKVVFATETLATGINMPAKTVMFSSMEKPTGLGDKESLRLLTSSEFQQMAGRAGRRGYDDIGNVVILQTQEDDLNIATNLANSPAVEIQSNFRPSYSLLTQIFSEMPDESYVDTIIEKSFLKYSSDIPEQLKKEFSETIKILEEKNYIKKEAGLYFLTNKGRLIKDIRSSNEMLLAETIDKGLLFDLKPAALAAIISSLTYESAKADIDFEIPNNDNLKEKVEKETKNLKKFKENILLQAEILGIKTKSINEVKEGLSKKRLNAAKLQKLEEQYKLYNAKAKFVEKISVPKMELDKYKLHNVIKSLKENNIKKIKEEFENNHNKELSPASKEIKKKITALLDKNDNNFYMYERALRETIKRLENSTDKTDKKKLNKINSYLQQIENNKASTTSVQTYEVIEYHYDKLSEEFPGGVNELSEKIKTEIYYQRKLKEKHNSFVKENGDYRNLNQQYKAIQQNLIKSGLLDNVGKYKVCIENTVKRLKDSTKQEDKEQLAKINKYITSMKTIELKQKELKEIEVQKAQNWQRLERLRKNYVNLKILIKAKEEYKDILNEYSELNYEKAAQGIKEQIDNNKYISSILKEIETYNSKYTENIVNMQNLAQSEDEAVDEEQIINILEQIYLESNEINSIQEDHEVKSIPKAIFNSNLATHMFKWANVPEEDGLSEKEWNNIIKGVIESTDMEYEGDFYRSINLTIDLLKQIMSISNYNKTQGLSIEMQKNYDELYQAASQAVNMLKKPPIYEPVEDYELDEEYND